MTEQEGQVATYDQDKAMEVGQSRTRGDDIEQSFARITQLQASLNACEAELQKCTAVNAELQAENENLRVQLESVCAIRDTLEEKAHERQARLAQLIESNANLEKRLAEATDAQTSSNTHGDEGEGRGRGRRRKRGGRRGTAEVSSGVESAATENDHARLISELERLASDLLEQTRAVDQARVELDSMRQEKVSIASQIEAQSAAHTMELKERNERLVDANKSIEQLREDNARLTREVNELQEAVDRNKAAPEGTENEFANTADFFRRRVEELVAENTRLEQRLGGAGSMETHALAGAQSRTIEHLSTDLQYKTQKIEQLLMDLRDLSAQRDTQSSVIEGLSQEKEGAESRAAQAEARVVAAERNAMHVAPPPTQPVQAVVSLPAQREADRETQFLVATVNEQRDTIWRMEEHTGKMEREIVTQKQALECIIEDKKALHTDAVELKKQLQWYTRRVKEVEEEKVELTMGLRASLEQIADERVELEAKLIALQETLEERKAAFPPPTQMAHPGVVWVDPTRPLTSPAQEAHQHKEQRPYLHSRVSYGEDPPLEPPHPPSYFTRSTIEPLPPPPAATPYWSPSSAPPPTTSTTLSSPSSEPHSES